MLPLSSAINILSSFLKVDSGSKYRLWKASVLHSWLWWVLRTQLEDSPLARDMTSSKGDHRLAGTELCLKSLVQFGPWGDPPSRFKGTALRGAVMWPETATSLMTK